MRPFKLFKHVISNLITKLSPPKSSPIIYIHTCIYLYMLLMSLSLSHCLVFGIRKITSHTDLVATTTCASQRLTIGPIERLTLNLTCFIRMFLMQVEPPSDLHLEIHSPSLVCGSFHMLACLNPLGLRLEAYLIQLYYLWGPMGIIEALELSCLPCSFSFLSFSSFAAF